MSITDFEKKLEAGTLTAKERADFKTYWQSVRLLVPEAFRQRIDDRL